MIVYDDDGFGGFGGFILDSSDFVWFLFIKNF